MRSKVAREEWGERVRAWRASGLSRAEFAQQTKVHPATLTWWRWKLASERGDLGRTGARTRRMESPIAFVELASPTGSLEHAGEGRIELEVGGIRLRIPDAFRPETLARVLEVLEGRR